MDEKKLNLLDAELDEESQKFIQETLNSWKESVMGQLMEEVEQIKAQKLEELEEENTAYREELKAEYAEKMLEGLAELKESVRAEVTASVVRNNPEVKILEQIKEMVAPLISENYREDTYQDTIAQLAEENEELRRELELNEGAKELANLLAPYEDTTKKFVLSMIHEGGPEEITTQFYEILEAFESTFGEADDSDDDETDDEDENEGGEKDGKKKKDEDEEDDSEDDSDDEDDETQEESYVEEGYNEDYEFEAPKQKRNSLADQLNSYVFN